MSLHPKAPASATPPPAGPVEGPRVEEIAGLVAKYGEPRVVALDVEMGADEFAYLMYSARDGRRSDATMAIRQGPRTFAFIRKYWYPDGIYRLPSGTVRLTEGVEEAAVRESKEETGLDVALERYLLRTESMFRHGNESCPWRSHVFLARPLGGTLDAIDKREIKEVVVRTVDEARSDAQPRMLALGIGGFRYRVRLQEELWDEMAKRGVP